MISENLKFCKFIGFVIPQEAYDFLKRKAIEQNRVVSNYTRSIVLDFIKKQIKYENEDEHNVTNKQNL